MKEISIEEAIVIYTKWKFSRYPRAGELYQGYIARFAEWIEKENGKTKISEIDEIDVGKYQNYLERKNYAQSSIHYFIIAIRDLLKYFYLRKDIDFNFQLIQLPKLINRYYRHAVKSDQVDQVVSIIGESLILELRDKLIYNFLFSSGVRVSELTGLNAAEIDINRQSISIPNKKHPNGRRVICWDDETHRLLMLWMEKRELIAKDEALFISLSGSEKYHRVSPRSVQRLVKKHAIRAGIKNSKTTTPHCLRHGFCQEALKNMRIEEVQQYMGHLHINSTKRYSTYENTELEEKYKLKFKRHASSPEKEKKWDDLINKKMTITESLLQKIIQESYFKNVDKSVHNY